MKIALVNNLYGATKRGGAELAVEAQEAILRRAGHKVVVVTTRPWGSGLPRIEDGIYRVGGLAGLYYHLGRLPIFLRVFWHLEEWLNLWRPWYLAMRLALTGCELLICHNLTGVSLWLPRMAKNFHMKSIVVVHDIQYLHPSGLLNIGHEKKIESFFAKLYQKFIKFNFQPVKKIIFPSTWLRDLSLEKNICQPDQSLLLPNSLFNFSDKSESVKVIKKERQLLFVGQLETHKGIEQLLEAFSMIESDYKLIVIGGGTLEKKLTDKYSANKKIIFRGKVSSNEVHLEMLRSACLVVPSICYENQPTVILEAFATGLAVLGSNFGGVAELIADGAGIQFDPREVQAIKNCITTFISMSEIDQQAIISTGTKKYIQLMENNYEKTFISLLN